MPAVLTYPGVYVEEIPSRVHAITGVATSITAFIGRALRGPIDVATTINSYGDFAKTFGGLWLDNALGYAVYDFFNNGGSQAVIVRLYHGVKSDGADVPAKYAISFGSYKLEAANEGTWGVKLRVVIDRDNLQDDAAASLGVTTADLFNLTVTDTGTGKSERFANLTLKDSPRRVDKVLAASSDLLHYVGTPDATNPPATGCDALTGFEQALAQAKKNLADKQNAGTATDDDKDAVTTAQTSLHNGITTALATVSDGTWLNVLDLLKDPSTKKGLYALKQTDLFNILCIPPYRAPADTLDVDVNLVSAAAAYCEARRAMLLVDAPKDWDTTDAAKKQFMDTSDHVGTRSRNAALYFPRLQKANPLRDNQIETFAACGAVAGIYASTDTSRGVWKAPAGLAATLNGVAGLSVQLTDAENGELNPLGINCLRAFPAAGRVVWGARTLRGSDQLTDEYKYVPVRRTALFIEESLYRGTQWVVFEPNDEPLWAQIRLNVGAFTHNLFRQGAFQGTTPREAYLVKCDKETTTQTDIDNGIVNIVVGFAPLKPAEFVVIQLQQIAGQIEV
jgi:phage tail sheath protein FI